MLLDDKFKYINYECIFLNYRYVYDIDLCMVEMNKYTFIIILINERISNMLLMNNDNMTDE